MLQLAKANCAILHKFTQFTRLGRAFKPKFVQVDTVIEGIKEYAIEHETSSIKYVKLYIDDKETTASQQKVFY